MNPRVRRVMLVGAVGSLVTVLCGSIVRPGPGLSIFWLGQVAGAPWLRALWTVASMIGVATLIATWVTLVGIARAAPLSNSTLRWITVLWAIPLAIGPALFSSDVFSYSAQGEIASRGLDPSRVGPAALGPGQFLDQVPRIWHHTPAPYGPLWLGLGSLLARVSGHNPSVMAALLRCVALLSVAACGWALVRLAKAFDREPSMVVVLGLLNPLVLLHLVSGAHNEATMLALLLWGLVAVSERRTVAGLVLIGLAGSVKAPALLALVFVGWRWLPDGVAIRRRVVAVIASLGIGAATMALVGWATGLGWGWIHTLGTPGRVRAIETPLGALSFGALQFSTALGLGLTKSAAVAAARLIGLAIAGALVACVLWRSRERVPIISLGVALLAVNLFGPALYPWYLVTPFVLVAFTSQPVMQRVIVSMTVFYALITEPSGDGLVFTLGGAAPWVIPTAIAVIAWWSWRATDQSALGVRGALA